MPMAASNSSACATHSAGLVLFGWRHELLADCFNAMMFGLLKIVYWDRDRAIQN
jgi:hypothetical protein